VAPHHARMTGIASRKVGYRLALAAILVAGVVVRIHDYGAWQAAPDVYRLDHGPVLLNLDGYYYLRIARDLARGGYEGADRLRTAPEPAPRPNPPPLLSVLVAVAAEATGLPLVHTAAMLPVVLSLAVAGPLLLLCRQLGLPRSGGLVATAIALTWIPYVNRTTLGWLDTDCLIPTFTLCAGAFAFGAGASRSGGRRACYLLAAVCNAALFAWWWDQTPEAVALICLVPLLVGAALCYRPGKREARIVAGASAIVAAACLALWPGPVVEGLRTVADVARDGGQGGGGGFPNPAEDVVELKPIGSAGALLWPVLLLGLGGLVRPLRRAPRAAAATLLVPVLLALSAAVVGLRALIFWGPVIGLSVASLMPAAGPNPDRKGKSWRIGGIAGLIAMLGMGIEFTRASPEPAIAPIVSAIAAIRAHTPEDAVIRTSWNHAYPIMYYTGRRTIADGEFMEGERQVYANAPLAHPDEAVARRLMRFYAARGMRGMRNVEALAGSDGTGLAWLLEWLGEPPEAGARELLEAVRKGEAADAPCASVDDCRAFLFPERVPPVYVLLTRESLTTRWFRYGSWDRAKGGSAEWALHVAEGAVRSGSKLHLGEGAVFDVGDGGRLKLATHGNTVVEAVGTLATHEGGATREIDYGHPEGLRIDWRPEEGVATIATANVGRSVFNRLFVRRKADRAAFRPVAVDDPAFTLWEVVAQGTASRTPGGTPAAERL